MNCDQANRIPINDYLLACGYKPIKPPTGNVSMFHSPIRLGDDNPSFAIYFDSNRWVDFGTNQKGSLVDLVMLMRNCTVNEALLHIKEIFANRIFSFYQATKPQRVRTKDSRLESLKIYPIKSPNIIRYIENRCIPPIVWQNCPFLFEAKYFISYEGKKTEYINLAVQNDEGGFDLRGFGKFKACIKPKAPTTINGMVEKCVNIFEGAFSYLGALASFQRIHFKNTSIVLNSLNMIPRIRPTLHKYERINLFLDNDESGEKATNKLLSEFPQAIDCRNYYHGAKDFNEYLIFYKSTREN